MAERQIAYLWVPYFGAGVARRAEPELDVRPLVLFDEQGRVLAVDVQAAQAGVSAGFTERQAAARCPEAAMLAAARFPVWEAQEDLLTRIRHYTDRWPGAPGCWRRGTRGHLAISPTFAAGRGCRGRWWLT